MHVSPKHEQDELKKLSNLFEVMEVHSLFGEYDLLTKIEAKDYTNIGERLLFIKLKQLEELQILKR